MPFDPSQPSEVISQPPAFDPTQPSEFVEVAEPEKQGVGNTDYRSLYSGGIDSLDLKLTTNQQKAFSQLDQNTTTPNETRARALNQSFIASKMPSMAPATLERNWEAVKMAYASHSLGLEQKPIADSALYSAISKNFQDEADIEANGEVKAWTWKAQAGSDVRLVGQNLGKFWGALNKPFFEIPEAPKDLPDLPGLGINNPAVLGGVYNAIKPLLEGIETPLGMMTMGAGAVASNGTRMAKLALGGMSAVFAGLMGKATYESSKQIRGVLDDPNSTFQDKVTAVVSPVATGAATLVAGLSGALDLMPAKRAAAVAEQLKGLPPAEAAQVLREEAKTIREAPPSVPETAEETITHDGNPPAPAARQSDFLDHAANLLDEIADPVKVAEVKAEAAKAAEPLKPTTKAEAPAEVTDEPAVKQTLDRIHGIKNASIDKELEDMGLPKATRGQKLEFEEARADAVTKMEADHTAGQKLVESLADNPRPVSGKENALLAVEITRRSIEREQAAKALVDAQESGDADAIKEARLKVAATRDAYAQAADVSAQVGTENSHGLAFRKMMLKEDYSLAAMERRRVTANDGKPLSEAQEANLRELNKKLNKTQKAIDSYLSRMSEVLADDSAPGTKPRKGPPNRVSAFISERAAEARARIQARMKEGQVNSGIDPTQLADHAIVGADYLAKGLTKFADWSVAMAKEFGEAIRPHLEGLWERANHERHDAARILAQREAETPEILAKKLENQKTRLEEHIAKREKMLESGDLSSPGKEANRPMVPELEEAKQRLEEINRKIAEVRKGPEKSPEEAKLDAFKSRTAARTEELQGKLDSGDLSPKPRKPLALDPEGIRLKADRERVKKEITLAELKDEQANRTRTEKVRDAFTAWVRAGALSYPTVLAKLTGAAVARTFTTPLEQAVGYGVSKMLPGLSKLAPREGVPEIKGALRAEAKALTEGMTTGMRGAWDLLRNKETDLAALFEKTHLPPTMAEYLGKLHGALKYPTKIAEYARSLELRTAHALRNGIDPTDPLTQMRLMHEAYMDSNRAIFMQDNGVVDAYKAGLAMLERTNKATGKPSPALQFLATGIKSQLPVVKVPTNVIAEASQILTGWLTGPAKAAFAYAHGIENLKPAEADAILRLMKKGSIGLALTALGVFKAEDIGGFYQKGEKRKDSDVQPGEVRVGDATVPSQLLHNPYATALSFGATMERAASSRFKKSDTEERGDFAGLIAAATGLIEEVPFVKETNVIGKLLDPRTQGNAVAEIGSSILVPGAVQFAAAQLDKEKPFDPTESPRARKPEGFVQTLEKKIPGLREDVPTKTSGKSKFRP